MKKIRKRLRKLNRWFWNDFMDMLPLIVIMLVLITWVAYILFESVRRWFA